MDPLAAILLTTGSLVGVLLWRFVPARAEWLTLPVVVPLGGLLLSIVFC